MILEITNACDGGCSHCMSDCKPDDDYMSWDTFKSALKFINKTGSKTVFFTGGEPSLHPDLIPFVQYFKAKHPNLAVSLMSNGNFIQDKKLTEDIIKRFLFIQITYDKRYYPNYIDLEYINKTYPDITTEDRIRSVVKMGRATQEEGAERKSPFCFNMRSLIKISNISFFEACVLMERNNKFCSWSILPNGDITISESMLCPPIGNINMSNPELTDSIRKFKCDSCIYADKLKQLGLPYTSIF